MKRHTPVMPTLAVILAAGAGSRFDGPEHKLLAKLDGKPIVRAAVDNAVEAGIGPVLVVTGAVDLADAVESNRGPWAEGATTSPIRIVHNPAWEQGQATSLQVAIAEARRSGHDAIVVGLGDQPFVLPATWQAVATCASPIAVATYGGRRRNPVRLHRDVWHLLPTDGDEGARRLFGLKPDLVQPVPSGGSAADIDTREDLQSWQSRSSTNSP